jgi:hypothetical protein
LRWSSILLSKPQEFGIFGDECRAGLPCRQEYLDVGRVAQLKITNVHWRRKLEASQGGSAGES